MKRFLPAVAALLVVAVLALRWLPRLDVGAAGRLPRILSGSFPVRVLTCEGEELEFAAPPQRVLPTNAAWVDFVSLLVRPSRVCALPEVAQGYSRLSGAEEGWAALPRFTGLLAENVLALEPDLVLAHSWQNPETLERLRSEGVPVLAVPVPESWDEIEATLVLLATVLNERERADELAREHAGRVEALRARTRQRAGLRALCYTNLGAGGWTAGARTTASILLELAGLRNAAAEIGIQGDAPADQELLLGLAPDLFVVGLPGSAERSAPSAEVLLGEPALAGLEAIRRKRIIRLPPPLFTTASSEILRGAERLADEVERLFEAEPGLSDGAARGDRPGGG